MDWEGGSEMYIWKGTVYKTFMSIFVISLLI